MQNAGIVQAIVSGCAFALLWFLGFLLLMAGVGDLKAE
jgi:hypothetical protein